LIPVFLFLPFASSIQNVSAPHDRLANVSEYVTRASRLLIRLLRLSLFEEEEGVLSRMVGETDTLLWRVIDHYVPEARAAVDMANFHAVGVDETSSRRGHDYITLFVDLEARRLLFATPGKDATTFERFATDLEAHAGSAQAVTDVSIDLSPAFQKGAKAKEHLPNAQVTFVLSTS
jgi:transposase